MACDPFWNKTVLACHFDGTNGSTTFTDEKGHTLTANGNVQISTTQSKFGGASAYFDGAGDYLVIPGDDMNIAQGDFTVEGWLYSGNTAGLGGTRNIAHFNAGSSGGLHIHRSDAGMLVVDNGSSATTHGNIVIQPFIWTHFAVVRSGSTVKGYVNGVECLSHTAQTYAAATQVQIARYWNASNVGDFLGYIDDLRITKAARYTANFTPPTSAFKDYALAGDENALVFDRVVPS